MKKKLAFSHMIDILFPILLFIILSMSAISVILLAANMYNNQNISSNNQYAERTSLSYIRQKILQHNENGCISLRNIDGTDCIVITQEYNSSDTDVEKETSYVTYLYAYDGYIREFFTTEDSKSNASDLVNNADKDFELKAGREIVPAKELTIKEILPSVFKFTCITSDGDLIDTVVAADGGSYE